MPKQITIVIADDHPLFRKGLRDVIKEESDLTIVGEAPDGDAALHLIEQYTPDVAILDVDMPKMTGLEVAKSIQRKKLFVGVVILSMHNEQAIFDRAMNAGVMGYVLKDSAVSDIVACIHSVVVARPYISPVLAQYLMRREPVSTKGYEEKLGISALSPAERKVLQFISLGKSTREIADELFISPKTVEHHRSHICSKLGISGTNALLRFALENKALL